MAPELTARELVDAFGREGVHQFIDAEVPAGVTHAETRRFLTTVGIPTNLQNFFLDLSDFEPLPERHARESAAGDWTWDLPDNTEQWYVLGGFSGGRVALNGGTGEVFFLADWDEPPAPLHSGVDALAYFMYAFQRDRRFYSHAYASQVDEDPDDERNEDYVYIESAVKLARELMAADPTPFTVAELPPYDMSDLYEDPFPDDFAGPWTQAFEDVAGGMWPDGVTDE